VLASVALPPAWLAAVLLLGRTIAEAHDLDCPSVDAIVTATGASKSQAYDVAAKIATLLPTLVRAPGRPLRAPSPTSADESGELTRTVLTYVMEHPGCVDRGAQRNRYAESFRRFVLELRAAHADADLDSFARDVGVPIGTLKDWLRSPGPPGDPSADTSAPSTSATDVSTPHVQTVIDAYSRWQGAFLDFCDHVRRDLHVPFGRDLVRRILEADGRRKPARRDGRSPDEIALRGAFRTYFAGAQWVGDGMQVPVVVDGERFVFNLELNVDAHAGALVGASVRDTEDSAAVVEAFQSGVATTGAPPIALLLDNKPSNHTADVDAALGATIRIRATPKRPQNKAHVEGAFGLFSQVLPSLALDTHSGAYEVALGFLRLVVDVWARTTNHRPRSDHNGRSRVDLYAQNPTDEQIERARRELRERCEQQERARRTLEARRRPEVLSLLDEHFARLELLDPKRHLRVAIAGYPKDAIVDGIWTFESKRRANTLPEGVDARYLLGIVKNIAAKTEGEILAECLYRGRLEARDHFLAPLRAEREALRAETDVLRVLRVCVANAMATTSNLERCFWLDAVVETLREQPEAGRETRFLHAAHLIEATFAVGPRERHDAVRYVADRLVPLT
jgi:transposase InsO family protein